MSIESLHETRTRMRKIKLDSWGFIFLSFPSFALHLEQSRTFRKFPTCCSLIFDPYAVASKPQRSSVDFKLIIVLVSV